MLQLNTSRALTVNDVAHILKVSPRTVQRRIHSGDLSAVKLPGSTEWRILPADLQRYLRGDATPRPSARAGQAAIHLNELDINGLVFQRCMQIGEELEELGSELDPQHVFLAEALGYVLDPLTGQIVSA